VTSSPSTDREDAVAAAAARTAQPGPHANPLDLLAPALVAFDEAGFVSFLSPEAERMFGRASSATAGTSVDVFLPALRSEMRGAAAAQVGAKRAARGRPARNVTLGILGDGRRVALDVAIEPLSFGPHALYLACLRDSADPDSMRERLQRAEKMAAIGRLASGIAHDFNNLLVVILGAGQLLRARIEDGHPLAGLADEIRFAGERASQLTGRLLALCRRSRQEAKVLDLNVVVAEMHHLVQRLLGERIQVAIVPGRDLGGVFADPGQVDNVILNLVVNARDAMPGGGRLTLSTENVTLGEAEARALACRPGRYVRLAVSDTGRGMDAATRSRLFEPFFTTKPPGQGTGLGLSTVKTIVAEAGGAIEVATEPGVGTTFRISLPRVGRPIALESLPLASRPARGDETILLVEDDLGVRRCVRSTLSVQGYRVIDAASGEEALAMSAAYPGRIHLLLTDVVMPGMDGVETAARLQRERASLRVLLTSGYPERTALDGRVPPPGAAFLRKPFSPDVLVAKVREVLDGRTADPRPLVPHA
jgi:signal transduction histidine kinase/ActR/RegA family two-component response regulator